MVQIPEMESWNDGGSGGGATHGPTVPQGGGGSGNNFSVPLKVKMVEILLVLQDLLAVVEPVEQVQNGAPGSGFTGPNRVEM